MPIKEWLSNAFRWVRTKVNKLIANLTPDENQQNDNDHSQRRGRRRFFSSNNSSTPVDNYTPLINDRTTAGNWPRYRGTAPYYHDTVEADGYFTDDDYEEVDGEAFWIQRAQEFRKEARAHRERKDQHYKEAKACRRAGAHRQSNIHQNNAKQYEAMMKEANRKAVECLMENNPNNTNTRIDLHHLYVSEALEEVEKKLRNIPNNVRKLDIITGRGNHSTDHIPKIKPKIIEYLQQNNYNYRETNPGCVTVYR